MANGLKEIKSIKVQPHPMKGRINRRREGKQAAWGRQLPAKAQIKEERRLQSGSVRRKEQAFVKSKHLVIAPYIYGLRLCAPLRLCEKYPKRDGNALAGHINKR